ncbi:unnamed protein product [Leptidea sinapis]|uniref:Uncharacterized protein n=1 Tax=Leptidea sinapis TaxID=189913 RepID=A0A5E4QNX5_9NEOP|nr:unnamed protein product [Leptidea sinapis]
MLHELPNKYHGVPFVPVGEEGYNNYLILNAAEKIQKNILEREKARKKSKKERDKLRKQYLASFGSVSINGSHSISQTKKPYNKFWPIDYGWEIDYYW